MTAPGHWSDAQLRRGALAAVLFVMVGADAWNDGSLGIVWQLADGLGDWGPPVALALHGVLLSAGLLLLGPRSWRAVLGGNRRPQDVLIAVACGLACAGLSFAYGKLLSMPDPWPENPGRTSGWLSDWVFSTIVGPFYEEVVFRGMLWVAVRRFCSVRVTVLITAVCFTLAHGPDRIFSYPYILLVGILLGWLRGRSGSLAVVFLAHSLTNAVIQGSLLWIVTSY
ncbi:MAG: CPBP family intramembrane metalloprotease [bacterium]|nr:CPBP family intramembrane metalloprotease [bacterium]